MIYKKREEPGCFYDLLKKLRGGMRTRSGGKAGGGRIFLRREKR
jgi:hypothetical protein